MYENPHKAPEANDTGTPLLASVEASRQENAVKSNNLDKAIHDFRSALNIVMGNSELMLDGIMGEMTEEQRSGLKDILANSRQMLDLINDVTIWKGALSDFKQ